MPRHVELAPFERLLIGDTCIRNGERRSRLQIDTDAKIIQGKYLILEHEADTPCKRLYVLVEYIYLEEDPTPFQTRFFTLATEIMRAVPTMAPFLADIDLRIQSGLFHKAMAAARDLIAYEATLNAIAAAQTLAAQTPMPAEPSAA